MGLIDICLSMEKKSLSLKLIIRASTFLFSINSFCLGSISDKFNYVEAEEISFKGNVYNFSEDYHAIEKSDILNIHKYLMVKNNIK